MPTKVREIPQGAHLPACTLGCTMHRRADRVYEDRLWTWALAHPGQKPHRSVSSSSD